MEAPINYVAWGFWREIFVLAGLAANIVYTWWVNREKVTAKRFAALEKQVAERLSVEKHDELDAAQADGCLAHRLRTERVEKEVQRLDSDLRHLPNHNDITRIHARMDDLHGALREMTGGMRALNASVSLINEHLLNKGGKG